MVAPLHCPLLPWLRSWTQERNRSCLRCGVGFLSTCILSQWLKYVFRCAPPLIRGALVMMWQTWTAFGIMLGYVMDLAFQNVRDPPGVTGLKWRLMLASVSLNFSLKHSPLRRYEPSSA